jgi:microcystin-dependent protein
MKKLNTFLTTVVLMFALMFFLGRLENMKTNAQTSNTGFNFIPPGMVAPFALPSCPAGWVEASGTAVNRASYPRLFAVMGVIHGNGNGTTTFNLPDYRGRFLRGFDGTSGNDPDKLTRTAMNPGGNAGNAIGSVQDDAFMDHNHRFNMGFSYDRAGSSQIISTSSTGNGTTTYDPWAGFSVMSTVAKINGGVLRVSTETRPKNAAVLFCVKI